MFVPFFLTITLLPLDLFSQDEDDTTTVKPLIQLLSESPDAISRARYNNFSVTLGFIFNIDWKKGLETDDI